jgi:RNA polymerase sigma-70 factor (ECF subfamily)
MRMRLSPPSSSRRSAARQIPAGAGAFAVVVWSGCAWIGRGEHMSWDEIKILVEKAQAGDRAAYGELVERFQPTVYAVALARLRNPTEAQELAQEVFLHGMEKLGQLRDAQCFAGWLRQITVRMAINRLTRGLPLHKVDAEVLDSTAAAGETPLDELVKTEQAAQLYRGLERLKPVDRATLVAFYIRGRTLKQMAREFETPVGTIKRRLHVARNRLKKVLQRDLAGV